MGIFGKKGAADQGTRTGQQGQNVDTKGMTWQEKQAAETANADAKKKNGS